MNYNDLSSKFAQVIEQIPRNVLYDFCCSYAQEHEELAMALVNEFWRPGKDDYRSMVQHIVHFSHAREKEPKSALPPRPPSKGDATAPPVALTFWYPRPIKGSGCDNCVDTLNLAYRRHKFSKEDLDFFHEAWKEIEKMEAVWNYGMGNFKFEF